MEFLYNCYIIKNVKRKLIDSEQKLLGLFGYDLS